jgi:hypothetical protein
MSREKKRDWVIPAFLVVAILLVMASAIRWIPEAYEGPDRAGEFGDMFGGANALFSGLAFVGVIYAILLQRRELQYQREELEQTRGELKGQRIQLEAQNRTFRQQTFDNAFFQMLSLHHQIVNSIDLTGPSADGDATKRGRDCFVKFYEDLKQLFSSDAQSKADPTRGNVLIAYGELYRKIQPDVGHYFRNLYNIIKFVDRSEIEEKRVYTNLVRAQLSSHELLLLFYNCLTHLGNEKFKPLVETYSLLKNMPDEDLLDVSHVRWYAESAYRGRESSGAAAENL